MQNHENIQCLTARLFGGPQTIRPAEVEADEDDQEINPAWELPVEQVVAMSEADYRRAHADLERDNCHSETIILEAKRTGNEAFVIEAEALQAECRKAGELTTPIHKRRMALYTAMNVFTGAWL